MYGTATEYAKGESYHMRRILPIALLSLVCLLLPACSSENIDVAKLTSDVVHRTQNASIFSRNRELFTDDPVDVFSKLSDFNITRCYQGMYPADLTDNWKSTAALVRRLKQIGIETVYLTGEPDWCDADTVKKWTIDKLLEYNSNVDNDAQILTIAFDVEFYSDPMKNNNSGYADYVKIMRPVCAYARDNGIRVLTVCQYWLPMTLSTDIFEQVLDFSDEISVMCYYRGAEAENLKTTYELCKKSGVDVECVFETDSPDEYSTHEINTYRNCGKTILFAAVEQLKDIYPDISIGYHSLSSIVNWK